MPRISITAKILILALLNVVLLALVFLFFARLQFRFELSSVLLAPARERIVSISRLAALQLPDTPQDQWTKLLDHYSSLYPAQFYLFGQDGALLAGRPVALPPQFLREMLRDPFAHAGRPGGPPPPPGEPRGSRPNFRDDGEGPPPGPPLSMGRGQFLDGPRRADSPLALLKTSSPSQYWVGVRIPIRTADRASPIHATLVWRFQSLWTEPFFFDYKPWAAVGLAVIIVSVACWLPLVRGLTRAISTITAATGRIAEGHFDIKLSARRRDELGRLSASINRMAERLAGYVYGQKRFLGDIAHELCSPIARMQMAIGILEQHANSKDASYVADTREELEHISALVNELLSFSKAQVGETRAERRRVSVREIVRRAVERETSSEVTVHVHVDEGTEALADPDYLFRALANVLRNAIRYAGNAGPIEISAQRREAQIQIVVADRGPGLPEGELENIFRPFYRPEFARQRETGGAGLGLAIVRDCIESCGGHVRCRNRSPQGLEVIVELPAAEKPNVSS